jgi:hypothetical protein
MNWLIAHRKIIMTLALITAQEYARNNWLLLFVLLWIILFGGWLFGSTLAPTTAHDILYQSVLFFVQASSICFVIFFWSLALFQEVKRKTIYLIFSHYRSHSAFILGKWLWISLFSFLFCVILSVLWAVFLLWQDVALNYGYLLNMGIIVIHTLSLAACIVFLSTILSPFVTIVAGLLLYRWWHIIGVALYTLQQQKEPVHWFLAYSLPFLIYILPPYRTLPPTSQFIMLLDNYQLLLQSVFFLCFYSIVCLILAIIIHKNTMFDRL